MNGIGKGLEVSIASATTAAILILIGCQGEESTTRPPTSVVETYSALSDSHWTVTETSYGSTGGYIVFRKSSAGVSFGSWQTAGSQLLAFTTDVINPGLADETWLLKMPFGRGSTWTAAGLSNGSAATSATVVNELAVPVTVPAGTFLCVLTTETITFPPGYDSTRMAIFEHRRYFAPGVGLVRVIAKRLNGSLITGDLQSYSVSPADSLDYFPLTDADSWTFKWTGL